MEFPSELKLCGLGSRDQREVHRSAFLVWLLVATIVRLMTTDDGLSIANAALREVLGEMMRGLKRARRHWRSNSLKLC